MLIRQSGKREPEFSVIHLRILQILASGLMVGLIGGCSKNEPQYVEVQTVEEKPAMGEDHSGHAHAQPQVGFDYTMPEGWEVVMTRPMQLLTVQAGESTSVPASVSVSAFPGDVGGQLANINRWRGQIGLGPVSEEVAGEFIKSVTVAGQDSWQVDFTGPAPAESHSAARLVVTAVPHNGQTWFFKIVGADSSVEAELEHYQAFLNSISF